jgi:hypothetical protein
MGFQFFVRRMESSLRRIKPMRISATMVLPTGPGFRVTSRHLACGVDEDDPALGHIVNPDAANLRPERGHYGRERDYANSSYAVCMRPTMNESCRRTGLR